MMANTQTAARAMLAMRSGWPKPALAVAPRTRPAAALASRPPITSTTMATIRFGSHSRSWRSTSDTAGSPSASKATTSTISFMNQFATMARKPAQSCCTPILRTKLPKPERSARSLKCTARNRRAASLAISPATNQPTTRITANAITLGIAAKNMARLPASAGSIASDASRIEAALEPPHALLRRPVRERLRNDATLRLLLQTVVADRGGGIQCFLQIALVELIHRAGVMAPDASVAIRLELHAHRDAVVFGFRDASLRCLQALEAAGQLLHVMAHLVRDDVRLREITWRLEAVLQVAIEGKVDVELLVVRAVERPHGRLPHAAGRAHHAVVEHERRRAILRVRLLEDPAPDVLGAAEHLGHELAHLVVRRAFARLARFTRRAHLLRHVDRRAGIKAEEVGDDGNNDAADAEAA